jgi:hypothetical protein
VNSNLAMGTGNFTIEFWLFTTNISQTGYILQTDILSTSLYVSLSGSTVRLTDQNTVFATTSTLLNNTWYHIAVVRSGTSSVIYTNGVAGTAVTCNINFSQNGPTIGANSFIGYLSDYRIVKGTAVYTTAFTPPSAPLTAIANTSLLVLQNNQSVNNSVFLDNSTNNLPVTYVGKATQGTFSPYGGNWSNYFDGTGDYLTLNGTPGTTLTGNFTLEAWVYVINFAASRAIICIGDVFGNPGVMFFIDTAGKLGISYANSRPYTGSGSLTANTWNHVAFVRNSGVITGYINGVSQGTLSTANTFSGTTSYIGLERYNGGAGGVIMFGYISNLRIVNSTAVYTGTFTPPTTPLTPITNTGLLTCADNRLIDDSINNFTITKNGDVSVQRFSPFNPSSLTATSYSGYFDGTGDYLTVPFNSAFNLGSGNFTIEFWVRTTSTAAYATALRLGDTWTTGSWALYLNDAGGSGVPSWWSFTLSNVLSTSGAAVNDGAWHHIALVRNSATMTMYIDGTSRGTLSVGANSVGDTSTSLWIARDASNVRELAGYLSNIRIVKGTALYTTSFTPSTTPLTTTSQGATASQVSLLTLQSTTFIDNSTNNFAITAFGNSQPKIQNPFGYTSATTQGYSVSTIGGSGYSNATGTIYSNIASPIAGNANAWTMECWVYFNTISGNVFIMGIGNNTGGNTPYLDLRISSTTVTLEESSTVSGIWAAAATFACTVGQWYHFAATRSGSTIRLFINGVQLASTTYASAIQSGLKPFTNGLLFSDGSARSDGVNGYVSDTRMIAGTALYTSNFVPPSQPLTAVQNTSWLINATSAGIYDAAMMTTMETIDGAKLSTAISKFGGSSMSFDGTNDQIQTPIIQPLRTGNFTIEFWIYPLDTASRYIFSFGEGWSPADGVSMIQYNGNYAITCGSYSTANAGQAVQINGWHHIAIVRNGTAVNFYYDGVSKASGTDSTNLTASKLDIGYAFTGGSWGTFYGYMDDFRITNGYARYTSNFTPPTSAFQLY